jgi:large subunit ribosomal protein L29
MPILRKRERAQLLPDERHKKLRELRTELAKMRTLVESGGRIDNPARIRELRKTIARLLTMETMDTRETKATKSPVNG